MKNRRKNNLFGCLHEFRQFFFITLLSVLSVNLYAQQRGIQGVVVMEKLSLELMSCRKTARLE